MPRRSETRDRIGASTSRVYEPADASPFLERASQTSVTDTKPTAPIRTAARKARVGAAGGVTIAVGIVMLPLPGPGTLVILGGLTMLGSEFPRARRLADEGWHRLGRVVGVFRRH